MANPDRAELIPAEVAVKASNRSQGMETAVAVLSVPAVVGRIGRAIGAGGAVAFAVNPVLGVGVGIAGLVVDLRPMATDLDAIPKVSRRERLLRRVVRTFNTVASSAFVASAFFYSGAAQSGVHRVGMIFGGLLAVALGADAAEAWRNRKLNKLKQARRRGDVYDITGIPREKAPRTAVGKLMDRIQKESNKPIAETWLGKLLKERGVRDEKPGKRQRAKAAMITAGESPEVAEATAHRKRTAEELGVTLSELENAFLRVVAENVNGGRTGEQAGSASEPARGTVIAPYGNGRRRQLGRTSPNVPEVG